MSKLQDGDVGGMWFEKNDATCFTARKTIQQLHELLPNRLILHFGAQIWTLRSCDFFFLICFILF